MCLETVEGLFYAGEIYKHFKFWGDKGVYGYRVNSVGRKVEDREEFCLIPQEGNKHLIVKLNNFRRLTVNKISIDGNDDYIRVHPRSGNEIDVS